MPQVLNRSSRLVSTPPHIGHLLWPGMNSAICVSLAERVIRSTGVRLTIEAPASCPRP